MLLGRSTLNIISTTQNHLQIKLINVLQPFLDVLVPLSGKVNTLQKVEYFEISDCLNRSNNHSLLKYLGILV